MLNVRLESSDQFLDGRYKMRSLYSRILTLSSEIRALGIAAGNGVKGN